MKTDFRREVFEYYQSFVVRIFIVISKNEPHSTTQRAFTEREGVSENKSVDVSAQTGKNR